MLSFRVLETLSSNRGTKPRILGFTICAIALLLVSGASGVVASTPGSSTSGARIPSQIISYLSNKPASSGCMSGAVSPFNITSTNCPNDGESITPQAQLTLDCSTKCFAGTQNTPTSNFINWWAFANAPSQNPSNLYYGSTSVSYWIGLQNCVGSCSVTKYLVQAGIYYGATSTYDSHHPVMFEEFAESSGSCSSWCGNYAAITPGDSMYFVVSYVSASNYWILYSQDCTPNPCTYSVYYVTVGSGSGEIPSSSLQNGLALTEGSGGTTSSNYFPPGTFTFTTMLGQDSNYNYQLGTAYYLWTPGSAPTATVGYSTSSCTLGGTQTTCASTSIAIS